MQFMDCGFREDMVLTLSISLKKKKQLQMFIPLALEMDI